MNGIPCPGCGHTASEVRDSRPYPGGWRRRRRCAACAVTFRTVEFVLPDDGIVVVPGTGGTPPTVQTLPVWLERMRERIAEAVAEACRR